MSVDTIAVVGCGQMGRGIALAAATKGFKVHSIKSRGGDLEPTKQRFDAALERRVKKGKLSAEEKEAILGRIQLSGDLGDVAGCGIVIESALEDFKVKAKLLGELEERMSPGAVLASNTSSLPLLRLAESVQRPEQLLALHFFNPAEVMKLVELGVTEHTAPGAIGSCEAFCRAIGKTPVEVCASPGYVVNRLLVPYLLHAIETLESGIASAEAIDTAMKLGCGHPMGPLSLADLIGLDVVAAMATTLKTELRDDRYRVPSLLRRLVNKQAFGRKSKLGIFDYRGPEPKLNPDLQALHVPRRLMDAAE